MEHCISLKISNLIDLSLFNYQCYFRKGYSAQHFLLGMIGKWKVSEDKGEVFDALLTNFSRTFDCGSYEIHLEHQYSLTAI